MEVSLLVASAKRLLDDIGKSNAKTLLNQTIGNLQSFLQNQSSPPQQRNQLLANFKNLEPQIVEAIRNLIPGTLSEKEAEAYIVLGAFDLFGTLGANQIAEIFAKVNAPSKPDAALQSLNQYSQRFSELENVSNILVAKLKNTGIQHSAKNTITFVFQGDVEINNLDELSKASNKWNQNLIALARLIRTNDTNFEIESAERGSLILTISAAGGIVLLFSKIVNSILDATKKYYEIKKLAGEMRKLSLPQLNDNLLDLEKKAEINIAQESESLASRLLIEYKWENETDKQEVSVALNYSVNHTFSFIANGGKAEVKLINRELPGEDSDIANVLNEKYRDLARLKSEISQITGAPEPLKIKDKEQK